MDAGLSTNNFAHGETRGGAVCVQTSDGRQPHDAPLQELGRFGPIVTQAGPEIPPPPPEPSSLPTLNYPPIVLVAAFGSGLILLALANHIWIGADDFWSELLLHLGAGILIAAVIFVVQRRFEKHARTLVAAQQRYQQVTRQHVDHLALVTQRASDQISQIDDHLRDLLTNEASRDREGAASFRDNGTHASIHRLLSRALEVDALSRLGFRVSIPQTILFLRVCPLDASVDERRRVIQFVVEDLNRSYGWRFDWNPGDSPERFLRAFHRELSKSGSAPKLDELSKQLGELRSTVAETLLLAIESRSGAVDGLYPIGRIFQRLSPEWYVTTTGLDNPYSGSRISVDDLRSNSHEHADTVGNWNQIVEMAQAVWRPSDGADRFW